MMRKLKKRKTPNFPDFTSLGLIMLASIGCVGFPAIPDRYLSNNKKKTTRENDFDFVVL